MNYSTASFYVCVHEHINDSFISDRVSLISHQHRSRCMSQADTVDNEASARVFARSRNREEQL